MVTNQYNYVPSPGLGDFPPSETIPDQSIPLRDVLDRYTTTSATPLTAPADTENLSFDLPAYATDKRGLEDYLHQVNEDMAVMQAAMLKQQQAAKLAMEQAAEEARKKAMRDEIIAEMRASRKGHASDDLII